MKTRFKLRVYKQNVGNFFNSEGSTRDTGMRWGPFISGGLAAAPVWESDRLEIWGVIERD